ncbi:hypothetical protein BST61_g11043 [Cercospora zeina]
MKSFALLAGAALALAAPQQAPTPANPPAPAYSTQANLEYKPEFNEACTLLGTHHKHGARVALRGSQANFCFLVDQGKTCSIDQLPAPFAGGLTSIQMPKQQVCTFYTESGCKGESINWDKHDEPLNLDDYSQGRFDKRVASLLCKKSYLHSVRDVLSSNTFSNVTESSAVTE